MSGKVRRVSSGGKSMARVQRVFFIDMLRRFVYTQIEGTPMRLIVLVLLLTATVFGQALTPEVASLEGEVKVAVLAPFPFPFLHNAPMLAIWTALPATHFVAIATYECETGVCETTLHAPRIQPCTMVPVLGARRILKVEVFAVAEVAKAVLTSPTQ